MIKDYKVFIAVRLKSKRLLRKALLEISGKTVLGILLERLEHSIPRQNIVVCTSDLEDDDELVEYCESRSTLVSRGSADDVIDRFLNAEQTYKTANIVRVTGDNPLTDPELILKLLEFHLKSCNEYTYTDCYPAGTRSEIIKTKSLRKIHDKLRAPENSEYMSFMLNRPDKLTVGCYREVRNVNTYPNLSLTIDNKEDFEQLKSIFSYFDNRLITRQQVLSWCCENEKKCITVPQDNNSDIDKNLYGYTDDN